MTLKANIGGSHLDEFLLRKESLHSSPHCLCGRLDGRSQYFLHYIYSSGVVDKRLECILERVGEILRLFYTATMVFVVVVVFFFWGGGVDSVSSRCSGENAAHP